MALFRKILSPIFLTASILIALFHPLVGLIILLFSFLIYQSAKIKNWLREDALAREKRKEEAAVYFNDFSKKTTEFLKDVNNPKKEEECNAAWKKAQEIMENNIDVRIALFIRFSLVVILTITIVITIFYFLDII